VKVKEWSLVPFKPNRARVGDELAALRTVANIPSEIEPPAWISNGAAATDFLPMQNGILDLRDGKLLPSSPDMIAIGAVDYDAALTISERPWQAGKVVPTGGGWERNPRRVVLAYSMRILSSVNSVGGRKYE
jgi:hypothetical protein